MKSKLSTTIKILEKIFYTIFVVVVIGIVGLFVASLFKIPGNVEIKIVKSGSMEPVIKTGSIVVIKPEKDYIIGDVITFGADTKTAVPTTHRIVASKEQGGATYYSTKGDANEEADPQETNKNTVIGKVLFTAPYAGYILNFAKQPNGFILLIALPAGLIVLYELISIWEEARKILRKKKGIEDREEDGKGEGAGDSPFTNLEKRRERLIQN